MNTSTRQLLFWCPRVLTLLFAGFLTLFSFDVFGEGYGFWGTVLGLSDALDPHGHRAGRPCPLLGWEWTGAVLFVALGLTYACFAVSRGHPEWTAIISGPLLLIAGLFLLNWLYRKQIRASA